ncbi:MAG: PEP-CTERM sorting domain-containing protein [Acidobacteriota bacterium]
MTNISGQAGKDAFPQFTASNFALTAAVPEPSTFALLGLGSLLLAARRLRPLRPRPR